MTHFEQWAAVGVIVIAIFLAAGGIGEKLSSNREDLGRIMDKMDKR